MQPLGTTDSVIVQKKINHLISLGNARIVGLAMPEETSLRGCSMRLSPVRLRDGYRTRREQR
jgi:hypothetical protein